MALPPELQHLETLVSYFVDQLVAEAMAPVPARDAQTPDMAKPEALAGGTSGFRSIGVGDPTARET